MQYVFSVGRLRYALSALQLALIIGLGSSPITHGLLAPASAFAAPPAAGAMTPLVQPVYPVQIVGSRTGVTGLCLGCEVSSTANVIDNDTSNKATISLTAGVGASASVSVQDADNTYPAGYFAGFILGSGDLLNAELLGALTVQTYNNGTLQQSGAADDLLKADLFQNASKSVVGIVATKPFDEIRVSAASLAGVAVSIDVFYAAVQSEPPAPVITGPADGSFVASAKPAISGTAAPASTVAVVEGAATVCTAKATDTGAWTCTPATPLSEGPHSISATATSVAGTGPASAAVGFTIDLTAPAAPVITSPAAGARINVATPMITGTAEPGSTVAVRDGAVAICAAVTSQDGAWSCAPQAPLTEGAHSVTARASDAAGNTSPASAAVEFTIDLTGPAAPALNSPADGSLLASATPTIAGTAEAGSTVTVRENGAAVCVATADAGGNWSCAPEAPLSQGPHTITASAVDAAGNAGPASAAVSFTVDTVAPGAPTLSSPADGGTINDDTPAFVGTAEAGSTVAVREGAALICGATADASGNWSCVPSTPLAAGAHAVAVTATDAAGNASAATSASFTIDAGAVSTPSILTPADGTFVMSTTPAVSGTADPNVTVTVREGAALVCSATAGTDGRWSCQSATLGEGGHTIEAVAASGNITSTPATSTFTVDVTAPTGAPTIASPAKGSRTNDPTVTFSGAGAEPGGTVTVREGNDVLCVAVVGADGAWSCATVTPLGDGPHSITAQAADQAGNAGPASAPRGFTVDTVAPDAPEITSPAAGGFTRDTTPTFRGTAEPNSAVTVTRGGAIVCIAATDANGDWSCAPEAPLGEGPHAVVATARDAAGNTSAASPLRVVTVDTTAPAAPVVNSPAAGSTISTLAPTFVGTAESGSTVTVKKGSTTVCSATVDVNGAWSCMSGASLGAGDQTVTLTARDAAGNTSAPVSHSFTIDADAVSAPVFVTPVEGAFVNSATPTIAGTADPNATVTVTRNGEPVCEATANAGGAWSCTPAAPLTDGEHTLMAVATNNQNVASPPATRSFTVDTAAPAAPAITSPADGGSTRDPKPTFSGTAEPNSTVTVAVDGADVCTATADASGNWSCKPTSPLGEGQHTVTVTAKDPAGNNGSASSARTVTVDTIAPSAPEVVSPAPGATTDDGTPVFSGTADPGATVAVSQGGQVICTATADASGNWSCTPEAPLGVGQHEVTVTATDAAGNSSAPKTFVVTVTEEQLFAVITSHENGGMALSRTPTVGGNASPNSIVTLVVDLDNNPATDNNVVYQTSASPEGVWSVDLGRATSVHSGLPPTGITIGTWVRFSATATRDGETTLASTVVVQIGAMIHLPLMYRQ